MSLRPLGRRLPGAFQGWALAALGAAMLMWTALVNGRPPVFTDTALYYAQAEYLFEALGWVAPAQAVTPPDDPTALPARPGAPNISAAIDRARSPVYGAPVYALQRLGGLWLAAAVQALAVSGTIYLLYRAAAPRRPRWGFLVLMLAMAAFSSLPVFASWIMPDVFAGVMGCGLLLLLVYPDRLGVAGKLGAAASTGFALAVHRSNLLDAAAVLVLAAPLLRLSGVRWMSLAGRTGALAGIALASVLAGALVEQPIQARAGEPIGTPPFLSARVLADGPGRLYLRQVCRGPETPFELCRFESRPFASSDQVLWSIRRRTAVFLAADPAQRLRMEHEDTRFAVDDWLAEPLPQARAAAWNVAQQFVEIFPDDPLRAQSFYVRDGYWRHTTLPRILPGAVACGRACRPVLDKTLAGWLGGIGLGVAALMLAWRLSAGDVWARLRRRAPRRTAAGPDDLVRLLAALALVLALLVVNAGVCGALSGPFSRYQSRLVWLAPMMAGLLVAGAGWRRRRR